MHQDLERHIKDWRLSDPELIVETATSVVYKVNVEGISAVLKLLTPIGVQDEWSGAEALRHFAGYGAVHIYQNSDVAHLLEYAGGGDLVPLVNDGMDRQATVIIADVLNKLHSSRESYFETDLIPLRRRFRSLFDKAQHDRRQNTPSIFIEGALVAEELLADQNNVCVLHGDIHHGNILYSEKRGWLAIDPKGLFGERTFDVANALCNPVSMPELVTNENRFIHNVNLFSQKLNISRCRILRYVFAYACLSACWSLEDGQDESLALSMAEITRSHIADHGCA